MIPPTSWVTRYNPAFFNPQNWKTTFNGRLTRKTVVSHTHGIAIVSTQASETTDVADIQQTLSLPSGDLIVRHQAVGSGTHAYEFLEFDRPFNLVITPRRNLLLKIWEVEMPLSKATYVPPPVNTGSVKPNQVVIQSINSSFSPVQLLEANDSRIGASLYNQTPPGNGAEMYIGFASDMNTNNYAAILKPQDYYEIPFGYTGPVWGMWSGGIGGSCKVTSFNFYES